MGHPGCHFANPQSLDVKTNEMSSQSQCGRMLQRWGLTRHFHSTLTYIMPYCRAYHLTQCVSAIAAYLFIRTICPPLFASACARFYTLLIVDTGWFHNAERKLSSDFLHFWTANPCQPRLQVFTLPRVRSEVKSLEFLDPTRWPEDVTGFRRPWFKAAGDDLSETSRP